MGKWRQKGHVWKRSQNLCFCRPQDCLRMPSSLCVQEIGGQGAEHPSWWSTALLVAFRRNGNDGPLSLQDGRWYGSQPGQLFCAMPDGDCFLCPRAWNSLESVALNRLCKTVWGAVQLRTGWVGASLGRLGGRMFQNEGAFAKALKKERIIVSLGQREGGEWSSRAQWRGNKCQAAPLRGDRPRGLLLGPCLHWGSLDFILSVLGTHCRF